MPQKKQKQEHTRSGEMTQQLRACTIPIECLSFSIRIRQLTNTSPQLPPSLQRSLNHFGHLPPGRTSKSCPGPGTTATYPYCYPITDAQREEAMRPGRAADSGNPPRLRQGGCSQSCCPTPAGSCRLCWLPWCWGLGGRRNRFQSRIQKYPATLLPHTLP